MIRMRKISSFRMPSFCLGRTLTSFRDVLQMDTTLSQRQLVRQQNVINHRNKNELGNVRSTLVKHVMKLCVCYDVALTRLSRPYFTLASHVN